jgi:nucleoside-diphosphate-sugar epimerase
VRVAVTGATGFVGGRLVAELALRGHAVHAFGRRAMPPRHGVSYTRWDLASGAPETIDAPETMDAVVHCASKVDDWGAASEFEAINVLGTRAVLQSFGAQGRFIYVSTASVYDLDASTRGVREDAPYARRYLNAYSRTKMLAECEVRGSGREWVILRPHAVYGPGDPTLVPRLLRARRFGSLLAVGNGRNRLSVTHVDNLVQAIVRAVERERPTRGIFNVADALTGTLDEILRTLLQRLGLACRIVYLPTPIAAPLARVLEHAYLLLGARRAPLLTPYVVRQLAHDFTLDITAAQRCLGYAPSVTYRDGPLTA